MPATTPTLAATTTLSGGPESDIISYSLALNSQVVSTTVQFAGWDRGLLQSFFVYAALDTTGDGAEDYVLQKRDGGEAAEVVRTHYGYPATCPATATFNDAARSLTLSTSAACVGNPASVRVSWNVDSSTDNAPGYNLFTSPAVRADSRTASGSAQLPGLRSPSTAAGSPSAAHPATWARRSSTRPAPPAVAPTTCSGAARSTHCPAVLRHTLVRGAIRQLWGALGAEYSTFGYPRTDEVATGGRPGAVNLFEGGAVYWSAQTGAHDIWGPIQQAWSTQGYEGGRLGFPSGQTFLFGSGYKQEFQGGNIVWTPEGGAAIAYR